jgi:hypothetical protein
MKTKEIGRDEKRLGRERCGFIGERRANEQSTLEIASQTVRHVCCFSTKPSINNSSLATSSSQTPWVSGFIPLHPAYAALGSAQFRRCCGVVPAKLSKCTKFLR